MHIANIGKYLAGLLSVLTLAACSSVTVTSDHAPIDFSGLKTYAWLNKSFTAENGKSNDLIDARVKRIVDKTMAAKKLQKVDKSSADFFVNYNVTSQEKTDINTYNSYDGYYPGYSWRNGFHRGRNYTYYDPTYTAPVQEQVLTVYQQGTLIIDIIDPKTNKLIWRGTGGKRLHDGLSQDEREKLVTEVVQRVLQQYPPKPVAT